MLCHKQYILVRKITNTSLNSEYNHKNRINYIEFHMANLSGKILDNFNTIANKNVLNMNNIEFAIFHFSQPLSKQHASRWPTGQLEIHMLH